MRPFRPLNTNDFFTVGNVYTRRAECPTGAREGTSTTVSVTLDASRLTEGSHAGIFHLGVARFAFSTDGKSFTDAGIDFMLRWGNYRGDRVGGYACTLGEETGESVTRLR